MAPEYSIGDNCMNSPQLRGVLFPIVSIPKDNPKIIVTYSNWANAIYIFSLALPYRLP